MLKIFTILCLAIILSTPKAQTQAYLFLESEPPNRTQQIEPINFNFVKVGATKVKSIYIGNSGNTVFRIRNIVFNSAGKGVFAYASNPVPPVRLNPNETIFIFLAFTPRTINFFFDTLLIYFDEPFEFIYELPVEGISFCVNEIFIPDTNATIGLNNFQVPIYYRGDRKIEESVEANLKFSLSFNSSVFLPSNFINATVEGYTQNGKYITYYLNIPKITIDSTTKIIAKIEGMTLLSNTDTTLFQFGETSSDSLGINFTSNGGVLSLKAICISEMSMVTALEDFFDFQISPNPSDGICTMDFFNIHENRNQEVTIILTNSLGQIIYQGEHIISNPKNYLVNFGFLPSGLYRISIIHKTYLRSSLLTIVK